MAGREQLIAQPVLADHPDGNEPVCIAQVLRRKVGGGENLIRADVEPEPIELLGMLLSRPSRVVGQKEDATGLIEAR